MDFQLQLFNFWPLLFSAISNMLIGALWYSPILFGNLWMKFAEITVEDIKKIDSRQSMLLGIIPSTLSVIFLYLVLMIANVNSIWGALVIGTIASVGFGGTSLLNNVIFEKRPIKLLLMNVGYSFVAWNIAAILITVWK